jgi:hypothetical protein
MDAKTAPIDSFWGALASKQEWRGEYPVLRFLSEMVLNVANGLFPDPNTNALRTTFDASPPITYIFARFQIALR